MTQIEHVQARAYSMPVTIPYVDRDFVLPLVLTRIETDDGVVGHGICTSPDFCPAMASFVNDVAGPSLRGMPPLETERIWQELHTRFNNWALTGVWSFVQSSLDIALWDLKGKLLGESVATLLGGARSRVPTYVTFGTSEHDLQGLVALARDLVAAGHRGLKMVVGGIRHRSAGDAGTAMESVNKRVGSLEQDVARVAAVRDAIGPDVQLMVDANCRLGLIDAQRLARAIAEFDIAWFEEPVTGNDPRLLHELRRSTSIPVAAGQRIGHIWAHRELVTSGAVDILQPNVLNGGGFTECSKVAALARGFNVPIETGGAWPHHNLHLHAGVSNGGSVEYHWLAWRIGELLYEDPPSTADGWAIVPERPGLGFDPRPDEALAPFEIGTATS